MQSPSIFLCFKILKKRYFNSNIYLYIIKQQMVHCIFLLLKKNKQTKKKKKGGIISLVWIIQVIKLMTRREKFNENVVTYITILINNQKKNIRCNTSIHKHRHLKRMFTGCTCLLPSLKSYSIQLNLKKRKRTIQMVCRSNCGKYKHIIIGNQFTFKC